MTSNIIPFPRQPANDNAADPPPQPGLRAFICYRTMQAGWSAFEMTDHSMAPHINKGEFAIIDETDREPMDGDLFLTQSKSGGERQVVELELFKRPECIRPTNGDWRGPYWRSIWAATISALDGSQNQRIRWSDGPYPEQYLRETLIGRVVGIYQPDFREQFARAA